MNMVEIIGNQYLRVLALEETVGRLQNENSQLKEQVMKLTPAPPVPEKDPATETAAVIPAAIDG